MAVLNPVNLLVPLNTYRSCGTPEYDYNQPVIGAEQYQVSDYICWPPTLLQPARSCCT